MKVQVFNDTHRTWRLHAAMEDVKHDKPSGTVKPLETLTVEVAEGENVFVKLWEDGAVLVRGEKQVDPALREAIDAMTSVLTREQVLQALNGEDTA